MGFIWLFWSNFLWAGRPPIGRSKVFFVSLIVDSIVLKFYIHAYQYICRILNTLRTTSDLLFILMLIMAESRVNSLFTLSVFQQISNFQGLEVISEARVLHGQQWSGRKLRWFVCCCYCWTTDGLQNYWRPGRPSENLIRKSFGTAGSWTGAWPIFRMSFLEAGIVTTGSWYWSDIGFPSISSAIA